MDTNGRQESRDQDDCLGDWQVTNLPHVDPVDRLLSAAEWPEPDRLALARLERQWQSLSRGRIRRRRVLWASAAAACLAVAAAVWWLRPPHGAGREEVAPIENRPKPAEAQVVHRPALPEPLPTDPDDGSAVAEPAETPNTDDFAPSAPSRPANAYERLVFTAVERRARSAALREHDAVLDESIDRLLALKAAAGATEAAAATGLGGAWNALPAGVTSDPALLAAAVSEPLMANRLSFERRLIERVPQFDAARQSAALHLLAHIGSRRSAPLLLDMSRHEATHVAAVRALARLGDPATIARVARGEPEEPLRQELFAALVNRREPQSLGLYLEFVTPRATRESALAALERVMDPPLALLFQTLDSPQQAQRLAAAVVLGRLDDPAVVERLREMVLRDVRRQEALVALLASSGEDATRFLVYARRDQRLVAAVQTAEFQLRFVSH